MDKKYLDKDELLYYFVDQVSNYYYKHGKTWGLWTDAEYIIEYFDDYTDEFNQLSEDDQGYILNKLDCKIFLPEMRRINK